ncbi:MAG: TolC family protein [Planctomycetota bacterium]|jgi:outer membrane protein TolC
MILGILIKNRRLARLVTYSLVLLFALVGCTSDPYEYKTGADEKVYGIIEQKWTDDLGSRTNYRISDTAAGPNDIQIERVVPPDGVLTLSRAVAMATAHNRQYQLERELLYVQALDLDLERHQYEPNPFGTGTVGYVEEDGDRATGASIAAGFNQLLASGGRISTRIGLAWADVITGDVRSGLSSILAVAITQPLLRGSGRKVALENLTQAERNVLYQIRTFNRFRKTFVVSIISQYYRVLQQLDNVNNAGQNYQRLLAIEQKLKHLTDSGKLPRHELQQARQDSLEANNTYIQAQKLYKQTLDEFKLQLALPTNTEFRLDESELAVLAGDQLGQPDFSEDQAIETALQQRLDLINSFDAIDDAERKVHVAIDSLRAQLDLIASTRMNDQLSDFTAFRKLDDETTLALALDLPLDRTIEQNAYRKSLIVLSQQKRAYEKMSDTAVLQVRKAYRDLLEAAQSYQIQKEGLTLAQKRYDDTSLLMQYGRASGRRVLDAQKDLFRSQNAATEALVNYTIANLDFYRDTGVLQVRPDGMWAGPQVAGLPLETAEPVITQDRLEVQSESVTFDVQESLEQPAIQIESAPAEKPAPVTPVDAEGYIKQWMNKRKGN